jgi:ABC-type transport system substrate-binding protein
VIDAPHRHGQRITRRAFLAGTMAAATAGGAAAIVGYARSRGSGDHHGVTPPALLPVRSRGGTLRVFNFDALQPDTLDPHRTLMGPIVDLHSAVFSKLLRYDDERAGTIVPDLCDGMPEQPDDVTYVIKVRTGVRFHDTPPFRIVHPDAAGRELDAEDVKASIERQVAGSGPQAPRYFRADQWSAIDMIEVRDPHTLAIHMKSPVAPFSAFLAGRHAFIVPKELATARDPMSHDLDMVGSGPFLLDGWKQGTSVRLIRNPDWFARDDLASGAGGGRPYVDAVEAILSPEQDVFLQWAMEHKRIDSTGFSEVSGLDQAQKTNLDDVVLEQADASSVLASRLLLDRPPFKDDRVRRALHLAVDRVALAGSLYPALAGAPSARLSGPVAPMSSWAMADEELRKRPGYRTGAARDEDLRAAKQLWSAALGDATPPPIKITFAGVPKIIPGHAADAIQRQLQDALGVRVTGETDPTGSVFILSRLNHNLDGATLDVVPFTFGFEDGGPDLDEWVYAHFHSGGPMNTYRLQDATLDAMLDKQRQEFDAAERRKQGLAIQDYLLAQVNARLDFLAPVQRRLTWGYVRNSTLAPAAGSMYHLADTWLDTSHPAWAERQA